MKQKRPRKFDQVVFFDLLKDYLNTSDYKIAEKLGVARHHYSQYTTGRNALKLSTACEWLQALELDVFDLARLVNKSLI